MRSLLKRRILWLSLLAATVTSVGIWFFLFRKPPDIHDFWAVRYEWDSARQETDAEKNARATRCLEVAQRHPGTVGGLSALLLASTRAPKTVAGTEANQQLARQIETAEIGNLATAFERGVLGNWRPLPKRRAGISRTGSPKPRPPQDRSITRCDLRYDETQRG